MLQFLSVGSRRVGVVPILHYPTSPSGDTSRWTDVSGFHVLTDVALSKSMSCHIFDLLTKIRAHGFSNDDKLKLEESNIRLKFRLPWPTNVRLPVIMLLTCCCGFGWRCHSQHLGMTDRSFNPNSAASFSVSL